MEKRGNIGNLQGIILALVVVGMFVGVGFLVLQGFLDELTAGTDAYDGVNKTVQALKKVPTFLGIVALVAVLAIVIALVIGSFGRMGGTSSM